MIPTASISRTAVATCTAGILLLLFTSVATGLLWLRSYYVTDCLATREGKGATAIWIFQGQIYHQGYWAPRLTSGKGWQYVQLSRERAEQEFDAGDNPFFHPRQVPLWLVTAFLAALAAAAYALRRGIKQNIRSRLSQAGFCANCGYNLCATQNRCPECGEKFVLRA